jgi:putative oxygen-independent coproporphyrinogen III oxidase
VTSATSAVPATAAAQGRQLAVYVHWPFCATICPYCDFNVYRARGRDTGALLDAIETDLAGWRARTGPRPVSSLFFGGGTPSLMAPGEVARVIGAVDRLWGLEPGAEITLEANPTDAETARFAGLRAAGVERLSLGLQALDDTSLRALGRFHSADEAMRAARLARSTFPRLSIDLIYARHDQTLPQWQNELARALTLEADHISPYQLTIEPGTAYERAVRRGVIRPAEDELGAQLYEVTQAALEAAGYEAYEVSNHARGPKARSRHNLAYWTSQDWVGAGPGAHGRLGFGAGRLATTAALRPQDYIAAVSAKGWGVTEIETLDDEAARDEYWLMGLRMLAGASEAAAPGRPLPQEAVTGAIQLGHVWQAGGNIGLTPTGRLLANRVIGDLLTA